MRVDQYIYCTMRFTVTAWVVVLVEPTEVALTTTVYDPTAEVGVDEPLPALTVLFPELHPLAPAAIAIARAATNSVPRRRLRGRAKHSMKAIAAPEPAAYHGAWRCERSARVGPALDLTPLTGMLRLAVGKEIVKVVVPVPPGTEVGLNEKAGVTPVVEADVTRKETVPVKPLTGATLNDAVVWVGDAMVMVGVDVARVKSAVDPGIVTGGVMAAQ